MGQNKRIKTIVLCGGGSGGHITPLVAVGSELRKRHGKGVRLVYIGEKNGKFRTIAENSGIFDECRYVFAGKLRRYHGESLIRRLTDFKTIFLNIRDVFLLGLGVFQAYFLIKKLRPDVILLKGGYVCVPVAFSANLNHIPMMTHDSDALPGLSNRLAARYAKYHATAMPPKYYNYPRDSIREVGVPVDQRFHVYSSQELSRVKKELSIDENSQVLLITGGSNGARRLNDWIIEILPELLDSLPNLYVLHHIGIGNEDQYDGLHEAYRDRITVFDLTNKLYDFSAISDVIVTRAGATTMAEFAAQKKACVVVPNPDLTGGHQLKNAKVFSDNKAAVIIQESQLKESVTVLETEIKKLLEDEKIRAQLGESLGAMIPKKPAAVQLADLLEEISR